MALDANDGTTGKAKPKVVQFFPEGEELATICARVFPPIKQFVERLICAGLTLLCAKPKVGKSWLLLAIALAMAVGGVVIGQRCMKRKSLLLMLEDSKPRLKGRAETLLMGLAVPLGITIFTRWPRGEEGLAELATWLTANPDVDFVGIDTLAKFSGPADPKGNGSLYQSDYERLNALQTMAQERDLAIVVLHHLRKADGDDPLDLVSGTLGLTGAADHIIIITGNKETGHKLVARGRDLPDVAWDMSFHQGHWSRVGDSEPKKRILDTVERIERDNQIRELHEEGMSEREIANELKCSKTLVNTVLKGNR